MVIFQKFKKLFLKIVHTLCGSFSHTFIERIWDNLIKRKQYNKCYPRSFIAYKGSLPNRYYLLHSLSNIPTYLSHIYWHSYINYLFIYLPITSPQLTFIPLDIFLINLNIHQRALGPCHHHYKYLVEITNYVIYDGLGWWKFIQIHLHGKISYIPNCKYNQRQKCKKNSCKSN
jgi:hypothetical protein